MYRRIAIEGLQPALSAERAERLWDGTLCVGRHGQKLHPQMGREGEKPWISQGLDDDGVAGRSQRTRNREQCTLRARTNQDSVG